MAFLNVWNALGLAVAAGLAVVTQSPIPLLVGGALEGAYLAVATSPVGSRKLFPRRWREADEARQRERREAKIAALGDADRQRAQRLDERRRDILRAAAENQRFAGGLLESEIDSVDDLIDAFLELAASRARWERHLATVDYDDLESETRRAETDAQQALDDEKRRLARRNLEVLSRRKDELGRMRKKIALAREEMELIENSFKLIADQVAVAQNPREIRGRLDEVLAAVEAVRETTADDDTLLRAAARRAPQGAGEAAKGDG
jgi:hypothetical protein